MMGSRQTARGALSNQSPLFIDNTNAGQFQRHVQPRIKRSHRPCSLAMIASGKENTSRFGTEILIAPSEPAMVPDPCGCGRKVGGLAWTLQRGTATRRYRKQGPDHADEIRGHHQPVTLSEAGRLCLRAVQGWGSDHSNSESRSRWIEVVGNVTSDQKF